jgi:hypothetical protein
MRFRVVVKGHSQHGASGTDEPKCGVHPCGLSRNRSTSKPSSSTARIPTPRYEVPCYKLKWIEASSRKSLMFQRMTTPASIVKINFIFTLIPFSSNKLPKVQSNIVQHDPSQHKIELAPFPEIILPKKDSCNIIPSQRRPMRTSQPSLILR